MGSHMRRVGAVVLQAGGICPQHLDVCVQALLSLAGLCLGAVHHAPVCVKPGTKTKLFPEPSCS